MKKARIHDWVRGFGYKKERLLSALTDSAQVISWYHFLQTQQ